MELGGIEPTLNHLLNQYFNSIYLLLLPNKKNEMTLEEFTKLIQESFNATTKLQSKEIYSKIKELKNDKGPFVDDFSIVELIFSH